jgi:hypothetical protein
MKLLNLLARHTAIYVAGLVAAVTVGATLVVHRSDGNSVPSTVGTAVEPTAILGHFRPSSGQFLSLRGADRVMIDLNAEQSAIVTGLINSTLLRTKLTKTTWEDLLGTSSHKRASIVQRPAFDVRIWLESKEESLSVEVWSEALGVVNFSNLGLYESDRETVSRLAEQIESYLRTKARGK